MFYIYVIQSLKDFKTYIGFAKSPEKRLREHNSGQVKSTRHRRPFKILFTERFDTLSEVKKRELYWKSGAGRRKLKEYFRNKTDLLN